MAAIGAAPVSLSAVKGSAALGRAPQPRSFCCKCFNTRASPSLRGGQCNTCHIMPTCKMRSRNARAYHKKNPVKKVLGKDLSPVDPESTAMEGGKEVSEQGVEVENGNLIGDTAEQVLSNSDETSFPALNVVAQDDLQQGKEANTAASSASDSLPGSSLVAEERSFINIVEDLMHKVKDAERNILMLNEARMQNLEQLEQMRRDNDALQAQVNVLQLQLAEAETKLKAAPQEKTKMKLLEQEIEVLQGKLSENTEVVKVISQQKADYSKLSEHAENLQTEVDKLDAVEAELKELNKENQILQDEIKSLQCDLVDLSKENEVIAQLKSEKDSLQKMVSEFEAKLAMAESNALELAKLKLEKQVVLENLQRLETVRPMISIDPQHSAGLKPAENQALQDKVIELQSMLLRFKSENEVLKQAQAENDVLREQIQMLEQRLVESDAEIRSQLEVYQAEVEAFQASLEQLKVEKNAFSQKERIDDMPWEFWSHLLLSIDGWLLEKKLLFADASALREMAWQRDPSIKDAFIAKKGVSDNDILSGLLELLKTKKRPGMHIVHIAAEMAPVAKVGGLGDVVTGLGKSLQRRGHLVEVVLPKYDCMDYSRINNLKILNMDLNSYFDGHTFKNKIWVGTVEGLPVYFIEPHHPAKLFWRGQVYGETDDFARFTYFSRAALEFVLQASKRPDIIHCHDWHTAAVAPLYWDLYVPQGLDSARVAFTCHNFEYQGTENPGALALCGLNPQRLHRPDRMQDNFVHSRINLLKGGIVFSNIVTTVSPTYAQEVQSAEGGKGLHWTLMAHSDKFFGILNGIDTESWNPASDLLIYHQYSAEDISGKAANKAALRATLRLSGAGPDLERPIVGCITRLVPQKGVHLIHHAIYRTLEQGGQFVLLGSSPIHQIQSEFEAISHQFENHPHVRLILKYDESLSHSIYAGADIFIIPSIFEPCGLTQMIAMGYGAIPVARRTGGLNDSVFDVDDETIPLQRRNGFTFSGMNEKDLNLALDRALNYYVHRREWWQDLVRNAMQMDFSWNTSADQYAELYERAFTRTKATS